MGIPVEGTHEFNDFFKSMDDEDKLYKTIDAILDRIAETPNMGELIEHKRIPKSIKKKFPDLDNLLRVKVTQDYRLLYTLLGYPNDKKAIVLMAIPHKEYDKIFGY
jgi:hypothetical protein